MRIYTSLLQQSILCLKNSKASKKAIKPKKYAFSKKVGLNTKCIKTKWNQKLEAKIIELFQVLHLIGKQAYKLELPKRSKIYNVFYVLLLKQDTTRKMQVDVNINRLDFQTGNSKECKVEKIWNSANHGKMLELGQQPGFYHLISWKNYI